MAQNTPQAETKLSTEDAITKLAEAILANQPQQRGPLEMSGISEERQNLMKGLEPDGSPKKPRKYRKIACKSPFTEATFTALVVESKAFKTGRIISIADYKHPEGTYDHESNGGRVPDGAPIFKDKARPAYIPPGHEPPKETLEQSFLTLRWQDYFQRDLRAIVGDSKKGQGAMRPEYCVNPKDIDTPWQDAIVDLDPGAEANE